MRYQNIAHLPMVRLTLFYLTVFFFCPPVSIAQEFDRYESRTDEVTIMLRLIDFKGKPLTNEAMKIVELTSRTSKTYTSTPDGLLIFKATSGSMFDVSFKYDPHYLTIDTKEYDRKTIHLLVEYEGTEEIERRKADRDTFEDMARAGRVLSNKESYKNDLENFSNGKYVFSDEVFLKVFKRNVKWKNKLIVCDITGSMYPYIGQVLLWYKLNYAGEKTSQLCFFNDGDGKPDDEKIIGETGGIYYCDKCTIDSLREVMARAMAGGGGGDGPENNLEALLKATDKMKGFRELIMVADNNSSVKDIELLHQLKIPVRIIVCGSNDRVGSDYLEIAYKTKGSVHTIEEDIETIASMKEGSVIKIGNRKYKLKKGKFIVVNAK